MWRRTPLASLVLLLSSCSNLPDSYPPPPQRKPFSGPEAVLQPAGYMVNMDDLNARSYFVRDIGEGVEGSGWRWTFRRPELKFPLKFTADLKLVVEFSLPHVTFKETGPVTVSFFVNGKLLDKIRYDQPGDKHFEKPVPPEWLPPNSVSTVAIEPDKHYIAPADGVALGVILMRAGFQR